MLPLRSIAMAVVLFGAACADEPTKPDPLPPPVDQGVNAYIVVDNLHAAVGQTVKVSLVVRAADANLKVGSYTGRLHFNAAQLQYKAEVAINDGLRVANPNGAGGGEIRFAGASATGRRARPARLWPRPRRGPEGRRRWPARSALRCS